MHVHIEGRGGGKVLGRLRSEYSLGEIERNFEGVAGGEKDNAETQRLAEERTGRSACATLVVRFG
jgi:hypothetical protein